MSSDHMQGTAAGYSPAELAQMAGVKALPIMLALKAAGREATLNQKVSVEDLAASLAHVQQVGMQSGSKKAPDALGLQVERWREALHKTALSVSGIGSCCVGASQGELASSDMREQFLDCYKTARETVNTLMVLRDELRTLDEGWFKATALAHDADGAAFRVAAGLGLTLRFDGGVAQSASPGAPCAYEVVSGHDRAAAMRQAVNQAAAVVAAGGESHEASMSKVRATTAAPELAPLDDGAVETILAAVGITVWGPQAEAVIRAVRVALAESKAAVQDIGVKR